MYSLCLLFAFEDGELPHLFLFFYSPGFQEIRFEFMGRFQNDCNLSPKLHHMDYSFWEYFETPLVSYGQTKSDRYLLFYVQMIFR